MNLPWDNYLDKKVIKAVNEIVFIIRYNLLFYMQDNNYFNYIKEYCNKNELHDKTSFMDLLYLTELSIADLIDMPNFYDFRNNN